MSQDKTVCEKAVRNKRRVLGFLLGGSLLGHSLATIAMEENRVLPIATKHLVAKQAHKMEMHGDVRVDNYYWLRDDNRQDKNVIDYLKAENQYTEQMLKSGQALRETLYNEMADRMSKEDQSVPYTYNGYIYRTVYEAGKDFPIYQRKPVDNSTDWQVMVDGNERAKGHKFYQLGGFAVTLDNKRIAVAEDTQGRRNYKISFKDFADADWQNDVIENTSGNILWANDGETLFYVRRDPQTLLPYQLVRHQYGTDSQQDKKVYQEEDERFYLSISESTSLDYILISSTSYSSSEYRLIDANQPQSEPQIFSARQAGREYDLDHFRGQFYIRSNHENPLFGLYRTDAINKPWEIVIAPQENTDLENFALFNDGLVVQERTKGLSSIRQIDWKTQQEKRVQFDDPAYMASLGYNPEPDTHFLRYSYSSMTTPSSVFQWNMQTGERELLKQQEVKGFSKENYASQRLWVKARDGVEVPVSLVYRKSLFKKGENPILIYGYGSYGISMDPYFSSALLSLLDRGFVYALVHVRGGGDLGKNWYLQGKLGNKMNSFHDFIDATKALIADGYGNSQRVYAEGGSAGGLLMGTVINQAPELYRGVIAKVPFVDVLTTMLDSSIPLTTGEYEEWGNPNNKEDYFRIKSYSPYDNIQHQRYPHLLVTTGLHDSQVQYWEPAKWVAKLREMKQGDSLLLLETNMDTGHGGKSGRFNRLNDIAFDYSFLLMLDDAKTYFPELKD
ncbi:S9 family peptidase [Xenorhabdus sp. DI]|uniref:S9 family peptidase n=1 Tax=Xenorhabdus doucetiae TaxID=351671 RepID=UPI001991A549|nr:MULTISPECIES: S9 family peptidase [unclassified Xenorhabdus]MBD2783668.1 S9 family peptidase [Xenorhabdus sp. 3]MBD2789659.1 S9 family peptidase [Xenorhabdus sp. DI]